MKHRILTQEQPVLQHRLDGSLCVMRGATAIPVTIRPCFPWSESRRYISLRDDEHNEVALVKELAALDASSRAALEQALAEAGFLLEVTQVLEVEEEVEIRHWRVRTRQGDRSFQTRLDDWPRSLPDGGFLIRDVAGDLYRIAAPEALDKRSRELLWAFVD
ncbi:MAG TPA: DUF1854 domain-containing protein [Gemmatimonadales bacterium]|jgi:hypothetical protein|nr:DUF1854 domain-containing protein [Gemmatimonadales bacterium]